MNPITCYIGLGSNLGDPAGNLRSALQQLAQTAGMALVAVSRFYASKPMGPQDQPDYVNAVACMRTTLDAPALLAALLKVEQAHGRIRDPAARWGPRILDLDLLWYGGQLIRSSALVVPHPGICERSFVAVPLAELAPDLVLPDGRSIQACVQALACDDLYPLE